MPSDDRLLLRLDGFEGPMDLLLDLARGQKVDLATISILSLVDQYLAIVDGARRVRLELAADWLVMAAWLTWLKSRLLLPPGTADAAEAEEAAEVLAARLQDLQAMRAASAWLSARPQLGHDVFARGAPEDLTERDRSRLLADVPGLLRGYLSAARRAGAQRQYRPHRLSLWSVPDALARIEAMLGIRPGWTDLQQFLPPLSSRLSQRAALASTLLAGLELARGGAATMRQDRAFGPILLRAG
ncbi:MAG: segregation/condensation protein A, partial [Gemmatimonadaceae bacterium]|nr:segregation/condensation protein A [Acetobacteraceae bacterium]